MSKSKDGSSSSNPWEALFASTTRPQASPSVSSIPSRTSDDTVDRDDAKSSRRIAKASSGGGYTILIQHSTTPESLRRWTSSSSSAVAASASATDRARNSAGSSTRASSNKNDAATTRAFRGSYFGASGPFLVRRAFEELCERCDGAVVFVSVIGGSGGVLDLDGLELLLEESHDGDYDNDGNEERPEEGSDGEDDDRESQGSSGARALGKRKNALRTFRRHGACVDLSSDPFGWEEDNFENNDSCGDNDSFVHRTTMNKLQTILMAIRRAAVDVEGRRPPSFQGRQQQKNGRKQQQRAMQKPVPIVFESLTPLLHAHGAEKIGLLMKSLGRSASSAAMTASANPPILSPIVAPVLYESLRPSEHRCLEDVADAMIHLTLLDARRSVSGNLSNDPSSAPVASGVLDMVRRGGGGGGGSDTGGKLIRHCVPLHVMRASASNSASSPADPRDAFYWILDRDDASDDAGEINTKDRRASRDQSSSAEDATTAGPPESSTKGPARPRIYLQDDDPEYEDYDEEDDLDDDLDL